MQAGNLPFAITLLLCAALPTDGQEPSLTLQISLAGTPDTRKTAERQEAV